MTTDTKKIKRMLNKMCKFYDCTLKTFYGLCLDEAMIQFEIDGGNVNWDSWNSLESSYIITPEDFIYSLKNKAVQWA